MARFGLPLSDSESESDKASTRSSVRESDGGESEEAPPQSWLDSDDDSDEDGSFEGGESSASSRTESDDHASASVSPPRVMAPRETPSKVKATTLRQGDHLAGPWPKKLKLEPKRVAVMQTSFFHQQDSATAGKTASEAKGKQKAPAELDWRPATATVTEPAAEQLEPARPRYKKIRRWERVPFEQSVTRAKENAHTRPILATSRAFKPGWGPQSTILHLGSLYGEQRPARSDTFLATKLRTTSGTLEDENTAALKLLEEQLKMSSVDVYDGVPSARANEDFRFHHLAGLLREKSSIEAEVFKLASALFDEIQDLDIPESFSSAQATYALELRRNAQVQQWLAEVVSDDVEADLRKVPARTAGANARRIFYLLTGHQITRASSAAIDNNDLRLATLVAQAGGDDAFREDMFLQLTKWREYRADAHIDPEYRKVYELLSGNVGLSEGVAHGDKVDGAPDLHVSEGLDWKRVFGLHLWYETYNASLKGAIERYEKASQTDNKVAPPLPPYLERPSKTTITWRQSHQITPRDPLFQLLKLYTDRTFPLEDVLLPQNFTSSPLDYRLSWHLYILLSRVLKVRDFEDRVAVDEDDMDVELVGNSVRADSITEAYAAQLEQSGVWEWAVFVLLHLELPERRERAIRELLCRNVDAITAESFEFVTNDLKLPMSWVYAAQALEVKYEDDLFEQYKLLVQADLPKEAHDVAAFQLAPETIIRNDFDLLRRLFEPFNPAQIPTWDQGGQIYVDYADCVDAFARVQLSKTSSSTTNLLKRCVRNVGSLEKARPDSLKLKLAASEMKRRLTLLAATQHADDDVGVSLPTKADQLVSLDSLNAAALSNALQAAGAA